MSARFDVANRKVLYTGGAGGLGTETTLALLAAGAEVHVLDFDAEKIATLESRAPEGSIHRLHLHRIDLLDKPSLAGLLERLAADRPIDVVINNAASYPSKPFEDYSDAELAAVHGVNVEAAQLCTRAALPGMRAQNWGRILNVTSITLSGQWENLVPYVQSKGALLGLTRAWAREFGKWGVTVNAISPGAFPTDAEKIHPDPEGYNAMVLDRQAVKRRGNPMDIAAAVMFLASEEAGFITGQSLAVNGGWVME
ncbi:SDR family NAD(P)-dependent oxidoreductase [Martelella radicis]|uniref:NAD(P)-dependent dehydrogenase (Short-subunit alcohol dehydrogenase family) n=1 Tax=Martelella radicis TaxID=1397476 RepID=A0A7W6P9T2_9HYPH|nr:SDR family oxidoreductase [Martelella radicis]MBB4122632.1 NAD(P)-dependent dehydrogenase (short-subunit alcohol dehydrogenase family) [Martelella radicis]